MNSTPHEIDVDRLDSERSASSTLVDVREPSEYVAGHVPGAVLVPMGQLAGRLDEIDKSGPVYVICASGNRSAAMTDVLLASGFDAYNVTGGTSAWARSGRPLETGAPATD